MMSSSEHEILADSELTEGLFEIDAKDVIADFGGHSAASFRKFLTETGSTMDLMFTYSVISRKGFMHFLLAIDNYARSTDSDSDCEFPGSLAHAILNQLRINAEAVFSMQEQIEDLCSYILRNLTKFDQGKDWENDTKSKLMKVFDALQNNTEAEQGGAGNPAKPGA